VRRLRKSVLSAERKAAMGQKEIDSKSRVRAADWFGRSVVIHLNKSVRIVECIIILYYYVLQLSAPAHLGTLNGMFQSI